MKHYRIKDIAAMAGVSTGTVDRILHNRGKVSEEAQRKVEAILKEIDYQPNMIARSLALKKRYRFLAIIPSYRQGEYWSQVKDGIIKAEHELHYYNIEVDCKFFNQYDNENLDAVLDSIKEEEYSGVVIATLFMESSLRFMKRLDTKEIPYVLIDSYLEGTNCLAYYGTDSFMSGYVGGKLLLEQITGDTDLVIFHMTLGEVINSTQNINREAGFHRYVSQQNYRGQIHSINITSNDDKRNYKLLDTFFEQHPLVKAGIIFNSRVHIIANYLKERKHSEFKLVGYDIINANIPGLDDGIVTHLIAQRPEVQGYNGIKALFRHLVLNENVEKINYMPMDILMKENVHYYNNYI